jgi:hypothetical protein
MKMRREMIRRIRSELLRARRERPCRRAPNS